MSRSLKVAIGVLVVAAVVIAVRLLPVGEWLTQFQTYVRHAGVTGYVVYVVVYALCVVLLVPATILTLGAGAIFGIAAGSAVVVAGATIGATAAFLLARTVLRKRVESMTAGKPKFRELDRAITREGAKIVLLIRLAPVFPFTYVNYAFGLTGVATLPYVAATLLGILPATVAFVYLGAAAGSAATGELQSTRTAINIAGAVVAVIASIYVARIALKAVRRAGV